MDDKVLKDLLSKYRQGTCTEEELALLENWVSVTTYSEYVISEKELREDFDLIAKALPLQKPKVRLWPRIAVAAAAITAITLGVWFYNISGTPRHTDAGQYPGSAQYANDVAPGRNTATLTLANGKTIVLSDAKIGVIIGLHKLAYNDGSVVRYSSGTPSSGSLKGEQMTTGPVGVHSLRVNELLTVATPRGGTYQVVLSDGTKVWLNADSKLVFPSNFGNTKQRIVNLSGEGYFEVTKNKNQPFIVESNGQQVKVLGTRFNINSYTDEGGTKTTLLEGSVDVNGTVLKPDQQATNTGNTIKVQEIDASSAIDWKNGEFVLGGQSLEAIMSKISRWYDVEVTYEDQQLKKQTFGGQVSRFVNVSEILDLMELTGFAHFKIEGRKIIVRK